MLFDFMFDLSSRFRPGLEARTWVDDVKSRTEGTAQLVTNRTVAFAKAFKDGLDELDLSFFSKPCVIASSSSIAKPSL